jgi:hypothetical protein
MGGSFRLGLTASTIGGQSDDATPELGNTFNVAGAFSSQR